MLQLPWEHKWCRPTKRKVYLYTSCKHAQEQLIQIHTNPLISCWNLNASSWNCSLSICVRGMNWEPEPVSLASTRHLECVGRLKTIRSYETPRTNGTQRTSSYPLFSMKAYLGIAFVSGTEVATQLSTNTRRGTWLYDLTEASILMKSPR